MIKMPTIPIAHLLRQLAFAVLPLFAGVFLPYLEFGSFGRFFNLFWGLIYGIGWNVAAHASGGPNAGVAPIFGSVLWPAAVSIVLFWLSGKPLAILSVVWRRAAIMSLIVTLLFVIPASLVGSAPFHSLPTFSNLFFVAW